MREFQRTNAIQALSKRYTKKTLGPLTTKKVNRKPNPNPLFHPEPNDLETPIVEDDLDDPEFVAAIQASVESQEDQEALDLQKAMELSATEGLGNPNPYSTSSNTGASSSRVTLDNSLSLNTPTKAPSRKVSTRANISDEEDLYASPTRLETALSIAGASPSKKPTSRINSGSFSHFFGTPSHLLQDSLVNAPRDKPAPKHVSFNDSRSFASPSTYTKKASPLSAKTLHEKPPSPVEISSDEDDLEEIIPEASVSSNVSTANDEAVGSSRASPIPIDDAQSDEDADMEEVPVAAPPVHVADANESEQPSPASSVENASGSRQSEMETAQNAHQSEGSSQGVVLEVAPPLELSNASLVDDRVPGSALILTPSREFIPTGLLADPSDNSSSEDEDAIPSFPVIPGIVETANDKGESSAKTKHAEVSEDWDAAQEMDPQAEEGEYVRFMSQVRGKDLETVRREIDDEIRSLNQQRKVAMRDSEDITQQMISQIMVRKFNSMLLWKRVSGTSKR